MLGYSRCQLTWQASRVDFVESGGPVELTSDASKLPQNAPECHDEGVPAVPVAALDEDESHVERDTKLSLMGLRHSCGQPEEEGTTKFGQELRGCQLKRK